MTKIIAVTECSAGNAETGSAWIEASSFDENTPVGNIVRWAMEKHNYISPDEPLYTVKGRLMITVEK